MVVMANPRDRKLVFLDEADVRSVLGMDELIGAMETALIDYSAGRVVQPHRQILPVPGRGGFFAAMPAVGEGVGVKLVTFYPGNADRGIHTHQAVIVLFEPQTGTLLSVMDGRAITEMRTAAVSAVATKALASADAKILAVLGTGLQARIHVDALERVRSFEEIRIWGRSPQKAAALAEEVGGRATSAEAAVRGADVVVTATAAKEAILAGNWLKPGAHVNAVGWNTNTGRELDDSAMGNLVIVESREGTAAESGNIRGSGATVYAEIGEVLAGVKPVDPARTTIFDSVGMAIEDVAAALLVWNARGRAPSGS
jgi:ornithine cyclodeaminase/alanine dehydrogenase-like protein (mu-crystallin family)